jgi:hypothetical protein
MLTLEASRKLNLSGNTTFRELLLSPLDSSLGPVVFQLELNPRDEVYIPLSPTHTLGRTAFTAFTTFTAFTPTDENSTIWKNNWSISVFLLYRF